MTDVAQNVADGADISYPNYTIPDNCTPSAKVSFPDGPVPLINTGVKLEHRKQKPFRSTTTADVYVPAEYEGEPWGRYVSGHMLNTADVFMWDFVTESYVHVLRGTPQAFGPGTETSNEMRLKVVGPETMLGDVPASISPDRPTLEDLVGYVAQRAEDEFPSFDSVSTDLDGGDLRILLDETTGNFESDRFDPEDLPEGFQDPSALGAIPSAVRDEYKPNRHSVTDILTDLWESTPFTFDFRMNPDGDGITLHAMWEGPQNSFRSSTHDGGLVVFDNGMLAEINPVNRIKVKGAINTDVEEWWGIFGDEKEPDKYPVAVAEHPPSRQIAGQVAMIERDSKASDLETVKEEARTALKEKLDGAGWGNAVLHLSPQLRPYDVVELPFQCRENSPLFDYEIERVTHWARPPEDSEYQNPITEMQCSFAVNYDEVEIVDNETDYVTIKDETE